MKMDEKEIPDLLVGILRKKTWIRSKVGKRALAMTWR